MTNTDNYRWALAWDLSIPPLLAVRGATLPDSDNAFFSGALCFGFGVLAYLLVEYLFHLGMHHFRARRHLDHHAQETAQIAFPFWVGAVSHAALWLLLSLVMSQALALCVVLGSAFGFAAYKAIHHLLHQAPDYSREWMPNIWQRHQHHHANAAKNFGVTSSLFDRLFGTYECING